MREPTESRENNSPKFAYVTLLRENVSSLRLEKGRFLTKFGPSLASVFDA